MNLLGGSCVGCPLIVCLSRFLLQGVGGYFNVANWVCGDKQLGWLVGLERLLID
jgi:hypothetical protein